MKKPICLNPTCSLHGSVESSHIIRYGFYRTTAGKRRRYRCVRCGQTFSTTKDTLALVRDVASRMTFTTCPVIVTDGFEFYGTVIRRVYGPAALYAQVIKTRRHDRVVRVDRRVVIGAAWRFDHALTHSEDSSTVNTSFIERLNLTIRQGSAYLSRRTLSHARVQDTLEAHLELLRCYYNFVRPHGALKFGRETRTPAMQAGLATRRLTLRDIFVSLRRVVWWLSVVRVFANPRRRAAAAVTYMPVAA